MLKMKVIRSLGAIVFILLMNNLSNPVKAGEVNNKDDEITGNIFRQRELITTNDRQGEQLQHIQPPQFSWKKWAVGSSLIVGCVYILFFDSLYQPLYQPLHQYGGGGGSGGGSAGMSW